MQVEQVTYEYKKGTDRWKIIAMPVYGSWKLWFYYNNKLVGEDFYDRLPSASNAYKLLPSVVK